MGNESEPTAEASSTGIAYVDYWPSQKARIEARQGVYDLGTPLTKPGAE
jgi:hypothetical protein